MFSTKSEYMQNINTVLHCKPHNNKAYEIRHWYTNTLETENEQQKNCWEDQLWVILKVALNWIKYVLSVKLHKRTLREIELSGPSLKRWIKRDLLNVELRRWIFIIASDEWLVQRKVYLWNDTWACHEDYYVFIQKRKLNIKWYEEERQKRGRQQ